MAQRKSSRGSPFSTWVILITLAALLWYGWRYYHLLGSGELAPVLPVHVDGATADRLRNRTIALISGHRGFDTGAICDDGLAEVDVNRTITRWVARLLDESGARVLLLDEYDSRLEGLEADVLLSIHADSCLPLSGFKVARWERSPEPARDDRLVRCLIERYAARTGLAFDETTITEDMTLYHAFRKIDAHTAAAIIEVGYLGGDRPLLTQKPQVAAMGIVEGLACYFDELSGMNPAMGVGDRTPSDK